MPDVFLRPGEASPADVRLRDTTLADSIGNPTLAITVTQAVATPTANLREDFILTAVAISQARATVSAAAIERFVLAISATQARPTLAGTAIERFVLGIAAAQPAASIAAALTAASTTRSVAVSVTQAAASVSTGLFTAVESSPAGGTGPFRLGPRVGPLVVVPVPTEVAVSVTQAPPSVVVALAQRPDDTWLVLGELELAA